MYKLHTTHRTCGLVIFRTRAANTSTRKFSSDAVPLVLCIIGGTIG